MDNINHEKKSLSLLERVEKSMKYFVAGSLIFSAAFASSFGYYSINKANTVKQQLAKERKLQDIRKAKIEKIKYQEKLKVQSEIDYKAGLSFYKKSKYDEAILYFDCVLDFDKDHYDSNFKIGECYSMIDKPKLAILHFDKILKLNPQDHKALNAKGMELINLQDYNGALGCIKEAIRIGKDTGSNSVSEYVSSLEYVYFMKQ